MGMRGIPGRAHGGEVRARPRVANAGPMVLVVEDDFALREALSERLGEEGFQVRSAGDGLQALAAISVRRPDVIVTDLMMPEMSGWELIAELERRPDLRSIPVIVVTASGHAPALSRHVPVLYKPVKADALIGAIEAVVAPAH
jgi:CheY-like chemotaxis protein